MVERQEVGFVGLGAMGSAMALRLLDQGFNVAVYNRTWDKTALLRAAGASVVATPALAAEKGVVLSMVTGDAALQAVVSGSDGILQGLPEGGLHISMSTVGVETARSLAGEHEDLRRLYLAAPVLGRPALAAQGEVALLLGGSDEAISQAAPIFTALTQNTFNVSVRAADASLLKLAVNFLISCAVEGLGEFFALTDRHEVNRSSALEVITATVFNDPVYKIYGSILADRKFVPPGYPLELGTKDNQLILEAAASAGLRLPLAELVRDRAAAALASGLMGQDWGVIGRMAEEDSARRVSADATPYEGEGG